MSRNSTLAKGAVRIALLCFFTTRVALAQDQGDGANDVPAGSRFAVGTGLRWDYNPEQTPGGDATRTGLTSTLDYSYRWDTQSTALSLEAGVDYVLGSGSGGLSAPQMELSFSNETARTRVTSELHYAEADVSSSTYGEASDGSIDIASGSGSVAQSQVKLGFAAGVDMPLSYDLSAQWRKADFSDSVSTSHFDNETVRGDVRVTAQVSPMTSLIFDAAHEEFDKDDSIRTGRNSDLARISVAQRLDRITVARVGFGHRRMERFSEVEDTENSGVTATFSLRREHRGGESLLRYTRDINSVGAWQTLSVGRETQLRDGQFNWSLGVIDTAQGKTEMIGDLTYRQELRNDYLAFGVTRRYGVNDASEDEMANRASLVFDHAFDEVSGVNARFSTTVLSAISGDDAQYDARLAYRRDLMAGVSLEAGMRFQVFDEAGEDRTKSGRVFLTLSREFFTR